MPVQPTRLTVYASLGLWPLDKNHVSLSSAHQHPLLSESIELCDLIYTALRTKSTRIGFYALIGVTLFQAVFVAISRPRTARCENKRTFLGSANSK